MYFAQLHVHHLFYSNKGVSRGGMGGGGGLGMFGGLCKTCAHKGAEKEDPALLPVSFLRYTVAGNVGCRAMCRRQVTEIAGVVQW